ncbi:alpha-N-acetylglucosaminidase TIM-barrel domain-containing protein [Actinophytocola sp.]|uniref:alpha-N-acetylglucosaminidase TIM-barrel domain-containing protein n=1 Tax=Actinophytocola sp. TaxID=1872138 RepID=UPI002ED2B118
MSPPWAEAVRQLWTRVVADTPPPHVHRLTGTRGFEVWADGPTVHVAATDAGAACAGIHRYLRDAHDVRVTWDTPLPLSIDPAPTRPPLRGRARVDRFYYLNFCTFSYSTAYWDWAEWEREIDWMALHGVTMPLNLVGHEAVLALAYSRLGMSDVDIRAFLGGPAYLPWLYMGCLDSFAGPMPASWLPRGLELGRRILDRQRSLGMTPALPAFTGHVPRQLAPAGAKTRLWQGMPTTVVPPEDPLFGRLAAEIVTAQRELLGTDHLYASDPFIEMIPDGDERYPAAVAAAVVDGLRAGDEDAVWVLQSWPFSYQRSHWTTERVNRFLDGIPDGRVLVLDLWGEADPQWPRLDGYGGRPWLWNGLLNFGGRTEPVADLSATSTNIEDALASDRPPVGLGLTMEAIHNNPAFFELVTDRAWDEPVPLAEWLADFGRQRHGDPAGSEAWQRLGASVLNATARSIFPESYIGIAVSTPDYTRMLDDRVHDDVRAALYYDPDDLVAAIRALARIPAAADDLALAGIALLLRVIDHRFSDLLRSIHTAQWDATDFLTVFDDLDGLAATRPTLRLDTWVAAAQRRAADDEERRVLEDNARRILTVWHTADNPFLDNYSARIWSGLVGGYLKRRWELWARFLPRALDPEGLAEAQSALDESLRDLAEEFIATGPASREPGDVVAVTEHVLARYGDEFCSRKGTHNVH